MKPDWWQKMLIRILIFLFFSIGGCTFADGKAKTDLLPPVKGTKFKVQCTARDIARGNTTQYSLDLTYNGDRKGKGVPKNVRDYREKQFSFTLEPTRLRSESVISKYYWQVLMDSYSYRYEKGNNTLYKDELIGELPKGFLTDWRKRVELKVNRYIKTGEAAETKDPEFIVTFRIAYKGEEELELGGKKFKTKKFNIKAYFSRNTSNFNSKNLNYMNSDFQDVWFSPETRLILLSRNVREFPEGRKESSCTAVSWTIPGRPDLNYSYELKKQ